MSPISSYGIPPLQGKTVQPPCIKPWLLSNIYSIPVLRSRQITTIPNFKYFETILLIHSINTTIYTKPQPFSAVSKLTWTDARSVVNTVDAINKYETVLVDVHGMRVCRKFVVALFFYVLRETIS